MISIQKRELYDATKVMAAPKIATGTSKISADFVTHFMKERDYPNWYRGLSFCQMNSADSLLKNIRDDSEQNTTHRVREALQRLGIHPLVSPKRIKLAMRLSRGNDIAFLWFLMELYYSGAAHKKGEYSLNEQIVMTAIAHLDAIPTLRELDRLLPKQPDKPKVVKPKKVLKKKLVHTLPYFEKQVKPSFYGKNLTLKEANNCVNFEYENDLNPNYIVPNESRWYSSYELSDGKRIAKWIMDDQLKTIFSTKPDQIAATSLCSHHSYIETVKSSLSRKLAMIRMDTCKNCFNIQEGAADDAYKRVIADIKRRVEEAEQELQRITKPILEAKKMCTPTCLQSEENGKVSFELIGAHSTKSVHSKPSVTEEEENIDFGHSDLRHIEHIYFQRPTHHTPYKFNYAEIFEQGSRDLIKMSAHYSLGGYCRDLSVDHAECIRKECKDLWNSSVEEYRIEQSRKTKELLKEGKYIKDELDCDMKYYDPNDQDLMTKMLQDAIKEMRNSKKYVLITFPDAHKTPFLKEFIKKRYGFVYTRDSKRSSFKQSKEVFHVLNRTEIRAKLPTSDDVATKRVVSYACNHYVRKKTNYLKERYNHNFKLSLMEHARNYWGAVRPYQCSNGPPRKEFFAYLPSRENDIHMFRPWKVDEYIRAKNEWDKRQRIKRTELFG